jgi:hypothetical protein
MSHFAYVQDGIVREVIVAEQDFIDGLPPRPGAWIQTSYNTYAGVHSQGGTPLRKNYAGPGMLYDAERDAFYATKPYHSWILDEETCIWMAPVPSPTAQNGELYFWNEDIRNWDVFVDPTI